tara:strand:+ start:7567 stop:8076 length:510 start_codon:yes stop_codon:yes gene_type:complete
MNIVSNAPQIFSLIEKKVKAYQDPNGIIHDKLIRSVAAGAAGELRRRVHVEGKKTDGNKIGTYEKKYLKLRQKPPYKRSADSTIVFSLSRQMENDLFLKAEVQAANPLDVPIKLSDGYGIGFKNVLNAKKADGLQFGNKTLKGFGVVYRLSNQEKALIKESVAIMLQKL